MIGGRNEARRCAGDGVAVDRLLVSQLLCVIAVSRRAGQHRYGQLGSVSRPVSVFYSGKYIAISLCNFSTCFSGRVEQSVGCVCPQTNCQTN